MRRGKSFHAQFRAWDTSANEPKPGDAANIIVPISRDGADAVLATNTVTEILDELGAASGLYDLLVTATESDVDTMTLMPRSSTPDIVCEWDFFTMEQFEGPYTRTIHIQDTGGNPVPDVRALVMNSAQTLNIDDKYTDVLGDAVFAPAAGTYKIRLAKAGWSFTVPETMVVTADGISTFVGTEVSTGAPIAGMQKLKGGCILPSDTPAEGCIVSAYITKKNVLVDHDILSCQKLEYTITSASKYWELILAQGVEYHILGKTPEGIVFLTATITVTDTAEVWIDEEYDIEPED